MQPDADRRRAARDVRRAPTRGPRPVDELIELVGLEAQARDARRRRSRAASAAGSTSRWRSPATPSSCSSTSRRPASTPHARREAWATIRDALRARQDRLPHDPLHGRGRRRSPTASPSCATARSSPRTPGPRSAAAARRRPRSASACPTGGRPSTCPSWPPPSVDARRRAACSSRPATASPPPTASPAGRSSAAIALDGLHCRQPTLEDVYLAPHRVGDPRMTATTAPLAVACVARVRLSDDVR